MQKAAVTTILPEGHDQVAVRPALRVRRGLACGQQQRRIAALIAGRTALKPTFRWPLHESLPPLEICRDPGGARHRPRVHAAQLLRRSAGGAGVERQGHGQGRFDARSTRSRARSQPSRHRSPTSCTFDNTSATRTFACACRTPTRNCAPRTLLQKALNPDPADPPTSSRSTCCRARRTGCTALHALPMYLGLDLRGGVHFLLQVDMKAALNKKARGATPATSARCCATRTSATPASTRDGQTRRRALPRRRPTRDKARAACSTTQFPDLQWPTRARRQRLAARRHAQAGGAEARRRTARSSRTSPPCTTASTSSASPSR